MDDISQSRITLSALLGSSIRQIGHIWGRVILWTILIFVVVSFVAVLIMSFTGGSLGGDGWSVSSYLYNWIALGLTYLTMVKLTGYLLIANGIQMGAEHRKPKLVRAGFVEIVAAAAVMAVPQTLALEDGLTTWDLIVSLPWSIADTCAIAVVLFAAVKRDADNQEVGKTITWREAPGPLTVKLAMVYAVLNSLSGLTLEYLRGLRVPADGADYGAFDATTEWIIYLSHIGAFGIFTALAAGMFVAWYSQLPSVRANVGGIRQIFG